MASNPYYNDVTPEVTELANLALANSSISPDDYVK